MSTLIGRISGARNEAERRLEQAPDHVRRGVLATAIVLISLASWPLTTIRPEAGLDLSWIAALHMAADQGLEFGKDFVFTYGPLGFLAVPRLFVGWTTFFGLLFTAATQMFLAWMLLRALRPRLGMIVGSITAFAVLAMLPAPAHGLGDRSLLVPAFMALMLIEQGPRTRHPFAWAAGLGAVVALWMLIKFSAVLLVPLGLIAAWESGRRGGRTAAAFVGSLVGCTIVFWVLTTGNPTSIPGWLRDSVSIAQGFDGALLLSVPERHWEIFPAIVISVLILVAVWRRDTSTDREARWSMLIGAALVLWLLFKQGFVRHDLHSYAFFAGATLLALILLKPGRAEVLTLIAAIVALATCIGAHRLDGAELLRADVHIRQAAGQFADTVVTSRRARVQRDARASMAMAFPISPAMLALVGRSTVHIVPHETTIVWTYRLNWRPAPVPQEYSAYTRHLSERNVRFLNSRMAPDFVIAHPGASSPDFSSWPSGSAVAILCNYREVAAENNLRLARRMGACQPERTITTVIAQPGQSIAVPRSPDPRDIIAARYTIPAEGFLGRLRTLAFRSGTNPPWVEFDGKEAERLVRATAGSLHLLRPATSPGAASVLFPSVDMATLSVQGTSEPTRIEFVALRLSG